MAINAPLASRRAFLAGLRAKPRNIAALGDADSGPEARNGNGNSTDQNRTNPAIRPPWAVAMASCTGCGDCIAACPENIITTDANHRPVIDFTRGECSFCASCADACTHAVFDRAIAQPWQLSVTVSAACFAEQGVYCRSCGDACPEGAIRILPLLGGRARALIDDQTCTGCGACLPTCPTGAISIHPSGDTQHG